MTFQYDLHGYLAKIESENSLLISGHFKEKWKNSEQLCPLSLHKSIGVADNKSTTSLYPYPIISRSFEGQVEEQPQNEENFFPF